MRARALLGAAVIAASFIPAPAWAAKYSPAQVKKYCNAIGGELLGFDEHGHYGCDGGADHAMVLCNKSNTCTVYRMATRTQRHRAERIMRVGTTR